MGVACFRNTFLGLVLGSVLCWGMDMQCVVGFGGDLCLESREILFGGVQI